MVVTLVVKVIFNHLKLNLSFAKEEKQWMERVLKRQKLDAEGQANIVLFQVKF